MEIEHIHILIFLFLISMKVCPWQLTVKPQASRLIATVHSLSLLIITILVNICWIFLCSNILNKKSLILYKVTDKMILLPCYIFYSRMKCWIFNKMNNSLTIIVKLLIICYFPSLIKKKYLQLIISLQVSIMVTLSASMVEGSIISINWKIQLITMYKYNH